MDQLRKDQESWGKIEVKSGLSNAEFVVNYARPGRPVVLSNLTKDWPAMSKWTPDFFRDHYGSIRVIIANTRIGKGVETNIADYMSYLLESNGQESAPMYLVDWVVARDCPELLEDYKIPVYFNNWLDRIPAEERPQWRWLYIGPKNSGSPLHLDVMNSSAWNAVITGQKRWVFFPPQDEPYLYDGKVDAFEPDLDAYPLFAKTHPVTCTQSSGEIIFTPSGWWHQVENLETCIAVTENFVNEYNYDYVRKSGESPNVLKLLKKYIPERHS